VIAAAVRGRDCAEKIQLSIQYDPDPPFDAGLPTKARSELIEHVLRDYDARKRVLRDYSARKR
jgi:cyclohexyl-isocyanide hydratase